MNKLLINILVICLLFSTMVYVVKTVPTGAGDCT
jgi:hypothetical protein